VIDGGKGQLSASLPPLRGFRERGTTVISLAKRLEEVYLPGRRAPLGIDHRAPALQLLQRVRDEAHRFAIEHHRERRSKAMTRSLLDDLPGIGPARKRALLAHFGSPASIVNASREELQAVPGLPPKVARELYGQLHRAG
jgi:excinuclease ABC subunit C